MSQGNFGEDDPELAGLEDVPVDCYTSFGVIEIDNPSSPGSPPMVIDFESQADHPLSYREMQRIGLAIAAQRIGSLAQYPNWANRFTTSPPFRIIPTGHVFGC